MIEMKQRNNLVSVVTSDGKNLSNAENVEGMQSTTATTTSDQHPNSSKKTSSFKASSIWLWCGEKMSLGICVQKSCLFGFGGVLLVVGVIMASCWPFIMKSVLKSQLSLTPGSRTYDMWVQTPLPMYLDIYLFNWTNSHNITAKPVLEQVGPFVFSEQHTKVNIAWNHNDSITYNQYRKWVYHPEMSNGSLSDKITNLNVIAVTIGSLIKSYNLPRFEKYGINMLLKIKENLIVTKNVSQLLFEGFSDPILDILEIFKKYNVSVPVEFDKFGWFYKRNMSETADGLFTMNTGAVDITKLGDVVTWNNKTKQSFYSGDCAKIQGSLGELWSPYSAKSDLVNLYAPDICGGIPLESSGLLSLHELSGKIFTGNRMVFDNGTASKQYGCYCIQGKQCQPSGVRDISLCRGGAPVYLSFPHFYLADESYSSAVVGMNPVPEKHSFNIALEEKTGVPLRVHARLQINLLVEKIDDLDFYKMPHTYMPMIWFDQRAEMTEKVAHDLKPLSVLAIYGIWVLVVLALIGTILVLAGVYLKLNNFWDSEMAPSQSETLLTDDDH